MAEGDDSTGRTGATGSARTPYETRLEGDNFKLRERIRVLKADVETAKKGAAPDGAVVLTGDDAKAYEAFKALNLAPAVIATQLKDGAEAKAALAESARVKSFDVLTEHGWNAPLLAKLGSPDKEGFTVALTEQTVDGKKVSVPVARKIGADGKPVGDPLPLEQFATEHLAEYGAALKATTDKGTTGGTTTTARTAGPPFPGNAAHGATGARPKTAQQIAEQKRASGVYTAL